MPNPIGNNSKPSKLSETLLSFKGSEQFRNLLLSKNLTPYVVEGSWAYPGIPNPSEVILSNLSPIDTPNVSDNIFKESEDSTSVNFYKSVENIDAAILFGNDSGAVSMQQAGVGNLQVKSSEQQVEYSLSSAELQLVSEFFIDTAAVINRYIPNDGYIETFVTTEVILPKVKSGAYPNFIIPEDFLLGIPQTNIINLSTFTVNDAQLANDSYLQQISAGFLAKSFRERIDREIQRATIGRVNLQAFQDPFTVALLATGQQPLISKNYVITVPDGVFDQASFLIQKFSGTYLPVSPIEGEYFTTPTTEVGRFRSAVSSFFSYFTKPATPTNRSIKFLNNTGSGQKDVLFTSLKYNKYRPNYEENKTQLGLVVDNIFNKSNSLGNLYVPFDTEDIQNLSTSTDIDKIGKTFEGSDLETRYKFGLSSIAYDNDPDPTGGFAWTQSDTYALAGKFMGQDGDQGPLSPEFNGVVQDKLNKYRSDNFEFKQGSILQKTQELVDATPKKAKERLTHVGNAINQISKVFNDGYKEITKGSKARKFITKNGQEVGAEYGRTFTKDIPYLTYNNLQKTTANNNGLEINGNIRKFTYSVLDSTYNLNIAPIGGEESTNVQNGSVKKYMFSIENLAWRNTPEFEDLPACEKGPNGGRIMWFPPYDLAIQQESSTPTFNPNNFLGRPEPIYTYESTKRSGGLSWSIIVDHPSVLNIIVKKELAKIDSSNNNLVTEVVNSFFNGLKKYDIYDLAARYYTIPKNIINEIYQEVLGNPETTEEEIKQVLDELPPQGDESPLSNTPTEVNGNYIGHSFFFPIYEGDESTNDYSVIKTAYESSIQEYVNGSESTNPNMGEVFFPILSYNYEMMVNLRNEVGEALQSGSNVELTFTSPSVLVLDSEQPSNSISISNDWLDSVKIFFNEYTLENGKKIKDYLNKKLKFKTESFATKAESNIIYQGSTVNTVNCKSSAFLTDQGRTQNSELLSYTFNAASCRAITLTKINVTPPDPIQSSGGGNKNPNSVPNQDALTGQKPDGQVNLDTKLKGISKRILRFLLSECDYFEYIKSSDSFIMDSIRNKIKFFNPAFHSMTPEGLNARLVFLNQCVRPGRTIPTVQEDNTSVLSNAFNTNFGTPPVLVLRFGDFYNTKIIPNGLSISYEPVLDINPEGIGVQPMIAKITLNFDMIGGHGLKEPVNKLQNALTFNYYANTEMYDERADATEDTTAVDNALIDSIRNEEPIANILNVNNTSTNEGTTFGEILSDTPSENGAQSGTIKYLKFFNGYIDSNKEYFQNLINGYESVINEYNLGVWAQINHKRNYKVGYINNISASSLTNLTTILGKQVTYTDALSSVSTLLKESIDNQTESLTLIIKNSGSLSPSAKQKVLNNYKQAADYAVLNNFNNISVKIQELTSAQLKMTKYMEKMDFISYGADAKVLNDNSNKIYVLSGQPINATDTLSEFLADYTITKDKVNEFYQETKNKIIFDDNYTSGTTTYYNPLSGLFINPSDVYVYTLFSTEILDANKLTNLQNRLVENVPPNYTAATISLISNHLNFYWVPMFSAEKAKEKQYFTDLKNSPQISPFLNYNPTDASSVSLTTKDRVMSFVTSGATQEMKTAYSNILSTVNTNEDTTVFNGKKQFDG